MPFEILKQWIAEENNAGAPDAMQAILSTATKNAIPHSRVIAIREITLNNLLFFTQAETRKVIELKSNPSVSLVFWFELKQRQIVIEGLTQALSSSENETYWNTYPRLSQIRFLSYAPTSGQPILSKQLLEDKKIQLTKTMGETIPVSPFYCGFRTIPSRFLFYTYRLDELSDVTEYTQKNGIWHQQVMSP